MELKINLLPAICVVVKVIFKITGSRQTDFTQEDFT
jgi:hypothetical protein